VGDAEQEARFAAKERSTSLYIYMADERRRCLHSFSLSDCSRCCRLRRKTQLLLLASLVVFAYFGSYIRSVVEDVAFIHIAYITRPLWDHAEQASIIPNYGYFGNHSCSWYGFEPRPPPPELPPVRVFDCFLFHSELDLLEIRLNELDGLVDMFVLVEGVRTFTDKEKPLYFAQVKHEQRFARFLPKIKHVVMQESDFKRIRFYSAFRREGSHRRFIMRALMQHGVSLRAGDLLVISDVDELVRRSTLQLARSVFVSLLTLLSCKSLAICLKLGLTGNATH
jgi:hypothetical protein